MRRMMLALGAFSLAVPAQMAIPAFTSKAEAATKRTYSGSSRVRKVCRYSKGTTGLVAGGVTGAVVGSKVIGGGLVGVAAGAVGGALAGRAIDRTITAKKRCRYVRY
jgi:outer membrane lipoprotein SlyB